MVLRYIRIDEHILVEKFWRLFISGSFDAESFCNCILKQLQIILQGSTTKLTSHSHNKIKHKKILQKC